VESTSENSAKTNPRNRQGKLIRCAFGVGAVLGFVALVVPSQMRPRWLFSLSLSSVEDFESKSPKVQTHPSPNLVGVSLSSRNPALTEQMKFLYKSEKDSNFNENFENLAFLFQSLEGSRYYLSSLSPEKMKRQDLIFQENRHGQLQALPVTQPLSETPDSPSLVFPQRVVDPSAPLQWHNFSWPSLLLDRFPFTLDQNVSGLRGERLEEFYFWKESLSAHSLRGKSVSLNTCSGHFPMTLQVNKMWQIFPETTPLSGTLLLHDSPVDGQHPDLKGSLRVERKNGLNDNQRLLTSVHGTHLAGVVSASRNDFGVTGVAPGLKVVSFELSVQPEKGGAISLVDVLEGLRAIDDFVKKEEQNRLLESAPARTQVVLLGYGFHSRSIAEEEKLKPLKDMIENLLSHNVLLVVPSGNSDPTFAVATEEHKVFPAAWSNEWKEKKGRLIAISASDLCSENAWFSESWPTLEGVRITAPGERIFSTFPSGDYGALSGTSQAAAQVAALLALGAAQSPPQSPDRLVKALIQSARPRKQFEESGMMPDAAGFLESLTESQSIER
jgi:hypothetical protein